MPTQLFVPLFRTEECLELMRECLEKGWTGLGYRTVEFEEEWKRYTGLTHAHFLNSATAGLSLAVKILKMKDEWQDDDEIISTPITFVSSNHVILYHNLKVVFADVDDSLCLDPKSIEARITKRTRAILFVGIGGDTGQFHEIVQICKRYNLRLIVDAAHMAGTRLNGVIPGSEADVVVYSFQAVKNLPTGDSGMICFKEKEHDEFCRKLAWLGISRDTYSRTNEKGAYKWKYDVEEVGYKYHGNSIMACIGIVQLKYLDQDNAYRRQIAYWYDQHFNAHPGIINPVPVSAECESSRHLYIIRVEDRDKLILALNESEVYPGVHYRDNTEYSMYAYAKGSCPNAQRNSQRVLSLPMHLKMTKQDVDYVSSLTVKYVSSIV